MIKVITIYLAGVFTIFSPCILPMLPIIFKGVLTESKTKLMILLSGLVVSYSIIGWSFAYFGSIFELNIVPHTMQETTLYEWQSGTQINLEVDLIARYLERLLQGDNAQSAKQAAGIDQNFLAEHGFF